MSKQDTQQQQQLLLYAARPIVEGQNTAIDEYGFYITAEDEEAAPPSPPIDDGFEHEEAFWVTSILQYAYLESARAGAAAAPTTPLSKQRTGSTDAAAILSADGDAAAEVASIHRFQHASPHRSSCSSDLFTSQLAARMRGRIRKHGGLPYSRLRRIVWGFFSGSGRRSPSAVISQRARYLQLADMAVDPDTADVIQRDLGRTFPLHCLFRETTSVGQVELRRILHAYCSYDPAVGYCQGMGFLVGVLLLNMPEDEAFWMLVHVMHGKRFAMRQLFLPSFPLLQKFFVILRQLLRKLQPALHAHFAEQGVDVAFFAAQWFMTLFAYQFPVALVCRVWDLFLSEGWKIIFKMSMALLQWEASSMLRLRMEGILLKLKDCHERKPPDMLLRRMLDVPITDEDLVVVDESG